MRMTEKMVSIAASDEKAANERSSPAQEGSIIFLLLLFIFILLVLILILPLLRANSPWLPVAMHSILHADYSADLHPSMQAPVSIGLIGDIIQDTNPTQAPQRLATVVSGLQSPVPTVTPYPTATPRPGETQVPVPTST